jgi:hypothetical protein
VIEGPPQLWVKWTCRRCGEGGVARTTFTIPEWFPEDAMRALLTDLRVKKLIPKHYVLHRCFAVADDFLIEATVPDHKVLVDRR